MLTLIAFIVAILVLVSVHELGHLLAARFFDIKVLRFSVGFGKPFWSKRWKNIEWCLAPIPLGGYVKMTDTREDDHIPPEDLPHAFDRQHPFKRMVVVIAGPLTNLVLAVIFFALTSWFGITEIKPWVGTVIDRSVAARAGFVPGEKILTVNGKAVDDFGDMTVQIMLAADMGNVKVRAENESGQIVEHIIDAEREKESLTAIARGHDLLGLMPNKPTRILAGVLPDGAAHAAGLRDGDEIVRINGETYDSWQSITAEIRRSAGRPLDVTYRRDGREHTTEVLPHSVEESPDLPLVGKIGTWWADDEAWNSLVISLRRPTARQSLVLGWEKTVDYSWLTLKFFGRMLIGQASVAHISGPITIADLAGKTAEMGMQAYVSFLALISLSLGILNLLPIPVLDGGHLLYYSIEWIRGKPLSPKTQEAGVRLGLAAMFLLMCIAFFNDITRLFG